MVLLPEPDNRARTSRHGGHALVDDEGGRWMVQRGTMDYAYIAVVGRDHR